MSAERRALFVLSLLWAKVFGAQDVPLNDIFSTANSLLQNVSDSQFKINKPYDPPLSLEEFKGLWPSYIQLNFVGGPDQQDLRHRFEILDNNMFVSAWISQIYLQIYQEGILEIDQAEVTSSVEAISNFHDKNTLEGSGMFSFWRQIEENGTWVAYPTNLEGLCNHSTLCEDMIAKAFRIPGDTDDSAVNLGLGAFLSQQRNSFPTAYSAWTENNSNITIFASAIKKYSYQPFVNNFNQQTIDTRTYYFLRDYLDVTGDVKLITTWFQNIDETRADFDASYVMPFNVNNVDASVGSNLIYGVTHAVLVELQDLVWFDSELQSIYLSASHYIAWTITSGRLRERPDLGLEYYPPTYDVLWMAGRTVALVNSWNSIVPPIVIEVSQILQAALQTDGLTWLEDTVQTNASQNYYYWDDFLGGNDTDANGKYLNSADDRLFSTSVVANSLIDTWTQINSKGCREWQTNTPTFVTEAVKGAMRFLTYESTSGRYRADNAFFSGSVKTGYDEPMDYPSNFNQFLNGTDYLNYNHNDSLLDFRSCGCLAEIITAVSGVIDKESYQQMLKLTWYGNTVTETFSGYNQASGELIFWNSHPLTQAITALALSKYVGMMQCGSA